MKKHQISIVELVDIKNYKNEFCGTAELAIWESSESIFRPRFSSLRAYLSYNYPEYDWQVDDGDDWNEDKNTDFVQYVAYLNEKKSQCLLASYHYQ